MRLIVLCLCALASSAADAHTTYRKDRVSLDGTWKFQLRHDNQLTGTGPVRFGPVSASSQAGLIAPWPGETSAGRWHTAVPFGLSATIVDSAPAAIASQQIWKPHPSQQGPTWWQADLGTKQSVHGVRIRWVKPGNVSLAAETSADGQEWRPWTPTSSTTDETETTVQAGPVEARYVRLTFAPAQFNGTRTIAVLIGGRAGSVTAWAPMVQRVWYDALRKFTPEDGFHRTDYNDQGWKPIQVPGYWEVQRFSPPTWWQPDDTVGCYRRTFEAPDSWRGRQVRLRFEGVNNSAQVWINGEEIGYHESGFTAFEFDVSAHLLFGRQNTISLRVQKWTLTHDYDTDDMWFLGGIWRSAYLYALPQDRIEDYWIRTELDRDYRDAILRARLALKSGDPLHARAAHVEGELTDSSGLRVPLQGFAADLTLAGRDPVPVELVARVPNPHKWTAETPALYSVALRLRVDDRVVQEFQTTIGFRQVEVRGASILLNGKPITIRGVVTTRANPTDADEPRERIFAREIQLLKEGNINAIRSHTTPLEEEFLDLCDRHGIYVIPDVPDVWVNEYDFRYLTDGNVLRAREIFEQHKNRASVIAWHIGNENGLSSAYRGMGQAAIWLHEADHTRPVMICSNRADLSEFGTEVNDQHYSPMTREEFRNPTDAPVVFGEFHALPEEIARLRDRGFVETWGRSLQLEWTEFLKRPWVAGGLICCWDDGSVNGDPGPRQWGVVDSKRQAKPVHHHIRKVFAPVRLKLADVAVRADGFQAKVSIENRFNFSDLTGFRFRWRLTAGGKELRTGEERCVVQPGFTGSMEVSSGLSDRPEVLEVSVTDAEGYSIQNEVFAMPAGDDGRTLLSRIGIRPERRRPEYTARATEQGEVVIRDRNGGEWFRIHEPVFEQGRSREANVPVGIVRCGEGQQGMSDLAIPCSVEGKLSGSVRVEVTSDRVNVSYDLVAAQDVLLREAGIAIRVPPEFGTLSWNRAALWNTGQTSGHDGPLELNVPAGTFAEEVSKRHVLWTSWSDGNRGLFLMPGSADTSLRSRAGGYVVSDFLGAGDFLGKFDRETIERRVRTGEHVKGGFTVYLLKRAQTRALETLPVPAKDLTWPSRAGTR